MTALKTILTHSHYCQNLGKHLTAGRYYNRWKPITALDFITYLIKFTESWEMWQIKRMLCIETRFLRYKNKVPTTCNLQLSVIEKFTFFRVCLYKGDICAWTKMNCWTFVSSPHLQMYYYTWQYFQSQLPQPNQKQSKKTFAGEVLVSVLVPFQATKADDFWYATKL